MPTLGREFAFVQTLRQFVRPPSPGFNEDDGSCCPQQFTGNRYAGRPASNNADIRLEG